MAKAKTLRIYLHQAQRQQAIAGRFNLMNRIKIAFEMRGFRVEFRRNSVEERLKSAKRRGYSLFMMDDPFHARSLSLRRTYFYPFWRIENTAKRWEFKAAKARFDPNDVNMNDAVTWADNWRKWIFKGSADGPTKEGVVYVPLQGRLLHHRSFQTMSPLEMIQATLGHEPIRRIMLGLHPNEDYSDKARDALDKLCRANPRLSVQTGGMEAALRVCDYVVAQNSAAALSGFFFHKPAILFAQIDFHHIAANVADLGVAAAFDAARSATPPYDSYLFWFIQKMSIKADEPDAEAQILDAVRSHGWVV